MSFVFDKNIPGEVRGALDVYLVPLEWLIPRWCERVNVGWKDDNDGCSMNVTVNFEYRFAEMEVRPAWLECEEDMRRDSCVHELIHLHVNPLYNFADRTVGILLDGEEKLKVHAQEEARRYCEGVTQDLAHVIGNYLNGSNPKTSKADALMMKAWRGMHATKKRPAKKGKSR